MTPNPALTRRAVRFGSDLRLQNVL